MIGKITGVLEYRGKEYVLISVHGIGYEVFLSDATLAQAPLVGKKMSVYTDLIVREDLLQLVGFGTRFEREWYRLLTGVQGVGSKAALKILGTLQINTLSRSILVGDVSTIRATPGIGPKIAQRIVSELKEKVPPLMASGTDFESNVEEAKSFNFSVTTDVRENYLVEETETVKMSQNQLQAEVLSALTNLGYSSHDAALAVSDVLREKENTPEVKEVIRAALKILSPKV